MKTCPAYDDHRARGLLPSWSEARKAEGFDRPRTVTMKRFLVKEGPGGSGRVVGLSLEGDGAFIYTRSAEWDDGNGAGTFREDTETAAIKKFYERITRNTEGRQ